MSDIARLKDLDNFFFYGQGELADEVKGDLLQLLVQPKRSLLYSRDRNSAGLESYENGPTTVSAQILIPYDVVAAVSRRNFTTGNGQNGTKERRIATSQGQVRVEQDRGQLDVSVFYIPFFDLKTKGTVSTTVGVNNG